VPGFLAPSFEGFYLAGDCGTGKAGLLFWKKSFMRGNRAFLSRLYTGVLRGGKCGTERKRSEAILTPNSAQNRLSIT
jgi:hypothetical protein